MKKQFMDTWAESSWNSLCRRLGSFDKSNVFSVKLKVVGTDIKNKICIFSGLKNQNCCILRSKSVLGQILMSQNFM